MTKISWRPHQNAYCQLLRTFCQEANEVVVVGGVVRDLLLSKVAEPRPIADLDLLLPVEALAVSRRVADQLGWAYYALDKRRGLARLILNDEHGETFVCDISSYFGNSIEEDLENRDFTINAMAFVAREESAGCLSGELIDFYNGQADLRDGIIRQVHANSLRNDPVRLLRAVRFAAQRGFVIDADTRAQIPLLAERIQLSSRERIRDELWKILSSAQPAAALAELQELDLLVYLVPALQATVGVAQSKPHHLDVFRHSLLAVAHAARLRRWLLEEQPGTTDDSPAVGALFSMLAQWRSELVAHFRARSSAYRTRAAWLPWHALLHDVGKPSTRTEEYDTEQYGEEGAARRIRFLGHEEASAKLVQALLIELRFSGDEVRLGKAVARAHMRPHHLNQSFGARPISRRACYRFFRAAGFDGDDHPYGVDVILLALADRLATGGELSEVDDASPHSSAAWKVWQGYLNHMHQLLDFAFSQKGIHEVRAYPLVDGSLLIERLALQPGPIIGKLLAHLAEAQAVGEIRTADEGLDLAVLWLQSHSAISVAENPGTEKSDAEIADTEIPDA